MPRLSIVIPWTGPAGPFEETLTAVLQNRPAHAEVLVVLAQPYHDPYGLAGEVEFITATAGDNSWPALVNQALEQVHAPVVQVLPAGYQVDEGWTAAALLQFCDARVAAVAPVVMQPEQRQRVVSAGLSFAPGSGRRLAERGAAYEVARLAASQPLGAPLAGGFFRTEVLQALGGFDPSLGAMADLDLALALAELGYRTECEPTSIVLEAIAPRQSAGFRAGVAREKLFWRHLASLDRRAAMPGHVTGILAEALLALLQPWNLPHLAGRLAGYALRSRDRLHAARIATARERLGDALSRDIVPLPAPRLRHAA